MAKGKKARQPQKPTLGKLPGLHLRKAEKKELRARMKRLTNRKWKVVWEKIEPVATEAEVKAMQRELRTEFQVLEKDAVREGQAIFEARYPDPRIRKEIINILVEEPELLTRPDTRPFRSPLAMEWLSQRVKHEAFKRLPEEKQKEIARQNVFKSRQEAERRRQAFARNVFHRFVDFVKRYRKENKGQEPPEKMQKGILTLLYEQEYKAQNV